MKCTAGVRLVFFFLFIRMLSDTSVWARPRAGWISKHCVLMASGFSVLWRRAKQNNVLSGRLGIVWYVYPNNAFDCACGISQLAEKELALFPLGLFIRAPSKYAMCSRKWKWMWKHDMANWLVIWCYLGGESLFSSSAVRMFLLPSFSSSCHILLWLHRDAHNHTPITMYIYSCHT